MQQHRGEPSGRIVAIILSAGQGTRMRAPRNKVFLSLGGAPILVRTIEAFAASPFVDEIVLVAHASELDFCQREIVERHTLTKVSAVVAGGATRHESEDCALGHLRTRIESGEIAMVMIHDGARPFVALEEIEALVQATQRTGGAILAAPLDGDDVIMLTDEDGHVEQVYAPDELARAQTPQSFEARSVLAAYDSARADGFIGTDTASSVERAGGRVAVVWSARANIKITTPDDLVRAESLLEQHGLGTRLGSGNDADTERRE